MHALMRRCADAPIADNDNLTGQMQECALFVFYAD